MRKLGIVHFARVDGCMLGFRTSNGGIPRKRFTLATNDKTLFDTLNSVRCNDKHEHTPLVGGNETSQSGHYTPEMARLIHKAWRNSVETRALATPSVLPAGIVAATRDPVPVSYTHLTLPTT